MPLLCSFFCISTPWKHLITWGQAWHGQKKDGKYELCVMECVCFCSCQALPAVPKLLLWSYLLAFIHTSILLYTSDMLLFWQHEEESKQTTTWCCICTIIHVCMHICLHACAPHMNRYSCVTETQASVHAYIHAYMNTFTHPCMDTYIYRQIHTCMHTRDLCFGRHPIIIEQISTRMSGSCMYICMYAWICCVCVCVSIHACVYCNHYRGNIDKNVR